MSKPNFIAYQTKITATTLNGFADILWDGIGANTVPNEVRNFIGAMPYDPDDGVIYGALNNDWTPISSDTITITWGDIAGDITNQIDLQSALDLKADVTYVDSEISTLTAYIDSENAAQDSEHIGLIIALG